LHISEEFDFVASVNMAFAARNGVVQSENDVVAVKDGKVTAGKTGQLLQQGSKRR
jgi:hypothetical protein